MAMNHGVGEVEVVDPVPNPNPDPPPQHKRKLLTQEIKNQLIDNIILIITLASVCIGLLIGICIVYTETKIPVDVVRFFQLPGNLLVQLLKMLMLPLVVSSCISGLTRITTKSVGVMSCISLCYYSLTTVGATLIGVILVSIIKPGNVDLKWNYNPPSINELVGKHGISPMDTVLDLLRNIFPNNIIKACVAQKTTRYEMKNGTSVIEKSIVDAPGMNLIGMVCFSTFFGIVMFRMGRSARLMDNFFTVLNDIIMRLVRLIMWFAPIGIIFLIIAKMSLLENPLEITSLLRYYIFTVIFGLTIHGALVLPTFYIVVTRKNPLMFIKSILPAWATAFGTASSAATLPVTYRCLEEFAGVDKRITRFVLPIGAAVNMDGTALFTAVSAIFVAQMNAISLSFWDIVTIGATSVLASVSAASFPSAGIFTMLMVFGSVGLPTNDIAIFLPLEWILDRVRTSVNVLGDSYGAGIVEELCKPYLRQSDREISEMRAKEDKIEAGPSEITKM